ncbi:hypothetical protein HDF16_002285 [Granulicella aggregans]|uniref:Nucleotide-binding protein HDF16_002285 n=1 Tax=Granulicella aggregans TaxID=474949 RepID=A0A7W7ZCT8_9BACT|nr:YajQ family cyclic di-GMP-binding protein [Granulicella aggregans]MBB5057579.1 hypothetical protein [Granulicella aggregans]
MASDSSFDVVSKVELQEVKNAIDQAVKEVGSRFDLKDSKSKIDLEGDDTIQLSSSDDYKLTAVKEILSQKLVKRGVSLKNLEFEKIEPAAGQSVRQKIKLVQGIPSDKAKIIVAAIKDSKKKANASIQGDTVRVVSKDKDTLQDIMSLLRAKDIGVDLQFTNFRSN